MGARDPNAGVAARSSDQRVERVAAAAGESVDAESAGADVEGPAEAIPKAVASGVELSRSGGQGLRERGVGELDQVVVAAVLVADGRKDIGALLGSIARRVVGAEQRSGPWMLEAVELCMQPRTKR